MSKTCQARLSTYGSLTRTNKENNFTQAHSQFKHLGPVAPTKLNSVLSCYPVSKVEFVFVQRDGKLSDN